eukprot:scpid67812/ scgid1743/ 
MAVVVSKSPIANPGRYNACRWQLMKNSAVFVSQVCIMIEIISGGSGSGGIMLAAADTATDLADQHNHDSTNWQENENNYMLEVRWQDCNSTGCLEPHRLSAPPSCQDGYTMIGTVETHCPQCDKTWRCPGCLPFDNHLCFSFGHRVTDGNRTCTVFNVPRLYKVRRCLACSSSCKQCDGTSSSACISCKSGKVLVSGKCLEPWIFIVLAAACGIVICIIISVVIITANIRYGYIDSTSCCVCTSIILILSLPFYLCHFISAILS